MSNRRNLRPKDIDTEIEKGQAPRDVNPRSQSLKKRNRGEDRAQKELEKKDEPEYPGSKE